MKFVQALGCLLASVAAVSAADSFYVYTCDGCGCNAAQAYGSSIEGTCTNLPANIVSTGISETKNAGTHCTLFSAQNCGGASQNIGVNSGQTWGCTGNTGALYGEYAKSMLCYWEGKRIFFRYGKMDCEGNVRSGAAIAKSAFRYIDAISLPLHVHNNLTLHQLYKDDFTIPLSWCINKFSSGL